MEGAHIEGRKPGTRKTRRFEEAGQPFCTDANGLGYEVQQDEIQGEAIGVVCKTWDKLARQ